MSAPAVEVAGPIARYESLVADIDALAAMESAAWTDDEVFAAAQLQEIALNRLAALGTRRLVDLTDRAIHVEKGYARPRDFLTAELHIPDAGKRLVHAKNLESMYALTGEKLPPVCPNLAEAAASGAAAPAHIDAALKVLDKVPAKVDADSRAAAEEMMAQFAREHSPADITKLGTRLLAHLDPDGKLTDDADRQRRRKLTLAPQDADLMSNLTGCLDPVTRAMFDVVLAAWAAPGMNNPDDQTPLTGSRQKYSKDQLDEAKKRDLRAPSQRNHDALKALLQAALDGKLLGKSHRGLPPHVIISITDTELRDYAGLGQTTTGALLPMKDVVKLAAKAQHHLAIFEEHTRKPLYYGRARRFASKAQRFTLFAKYGGCSRPGCSLPFAHTEIHHTPDYQHGGLTDVSDMAPACGPHNRSVGPNPGQHTTAPIASGPDIGHIGWTNNPADNNPSRPPRTNMTHRLGVVLHRYVTELRRRSGEESSTTEESVDPP